MNENPSPRIRELEQQIAQWNDEQFYRIQEWREHNQDLKRTLALALRVAIWGAIPSLAWILVWIVVNNWDEPLSSRLFSACGTLLTLTVVLAGATRGSGLLAHWWFRRSIINQRTATVIITLTAVAVLFGWVVVLF